MITREESKRLFYSVPLEIQHETIGFLLKMRDDYIASNFSVDLPYFVANVWRDLFETEEERQEYMDIVTSDEFVDATIFYIVRHLVSFI